MKKTIKKVTKFITPRLFYLLAGFFLTAALYTAQADWDSPVASNDPLTSTLWNDVVAKLEDLDARVKDELDCSVYTGIGDNEDDGTWRLPDHSLDPSVATILCPNERPFLSRIVVTNWDGDTAQYTLTCCKLK